MAELVYSRSKPVLADGQVYRNPRFFAGAEAAEKVTVHGDEPRIVAAYTAAGVPVERAGVASEPPPEPVPFVREPVTDDARSEIAIPDDWNTLTWYDLRMLAQSLAKAPVINRIGATEIIEAELARRAEEQAAS